jgi:hypothetical protein
VLFCWRVSNFRCEFAKETTYRICSCPEVETRGWSQKRSLRLAVIERLLQNLRESGTSHVLGYLLLALRPLTLVSMYASSRCKRKFYVLVGCRKSSFAGAASRRQHGTRCPRRGEVVRLLVDEQNPDLELPLRRVIRPLCRRNICAFSQLQQRLVGNDLDSCCDWRLDDGDEGGASTRGCEAGEVERRKALLRVACHECWALTAIILGASSSASNVSGK